MPEYVCKGAKLKCLMGDSESELEILPGNGEFLGGKEMANITDCQPIINIQSFGQCQSLANPIVALATVENLGKLQPMPCIPYPIPEIKWMKGNVDFPVRGEPALMDDDKLYCMWLGLIEVSDSGQEKSSATTDTGGPKVTTGSGPVKKAEIADCMVLFRPNMTYNGEFGFDWIRREDENVLFHGSGFRKFPDTKDVLGKHINEGCEKKWQCEKLINGECLDSAKNPNKRCLNPKFLNDKKKFLNSDNNHCKSRLNIHTECSQATNCFDKTRNPEGTCRDMNTWLGFHDNYHRLCTPCGAACFSEDLNPKKVCQDINSWSTPDNFQKDADSNGSMFLSLQKYFKQTHIRGFSDMYYEPVLTILPGVDISMQLKIQIRKKALEKDLIWEYDRKLFDIPKPSVQVDKNAPLDEWKDYPFNLKCLKEFQKDQYIKVYYDGRICGSLRILANDCTHQTKKNVVLVRIEADIGNKSRTGEFSDMEITVLENILKQGYVLINKEGNKLHTYTLSLDNGSLSPYVTYNTETKQYELKSDVRLLTFLDGEMKRNEFARNKYCKEEDDFFIIYSFNEDCGKWGGFSAGGNSCVKFKASLYPSISPHELLHSLKLAHTFNADGLKVEKIEIPEITYKATNTDNVMDYIAIDGTQLRSTFYWQWRLINTNISK